MLNSKFEIRILCTMLALLVTLTSFPFPAEAATSARPVSSQASNKAIKFKDANLEKLIRQQIYKPTGALYASDVADLSDLSIIVDYGIKSIEGIEQLTSLRTLGLYDNPVTDLSPLAKLPALEYLSLSKLTESNMTTVVPKLKKLQSLTLYHFELTEISFLGTMTNLTSLNISSNRVTDITPVSKLKKLTSFNGEYNEIVDLSPLAKLPLRMIYVSHNRIESIEPLAKLPAKDELFAISLRWNQIKDISVLAEFPNLLSFSLQDNPIKSYLPVYPMLSKTKNGDFHLTAEDLNQPIAFPDSGLEAAIRKAVGKPQGALMIRDVNTLFTLNASGRKIKSLEGMQYLPQLVHADFSGNQIKDLKPLQGLTQLRTLKLSKNPVANFADIRDVIRGLTSKDFDPKFTFQAKATVNSFMELVRTVEAGLDHPGKEMNITVKNASMHNGTVNGNMFSYLFTKYPAVSGTFTYISPTEVQKSAISFYILSGAGYKTYKGSVNLITSKITFNPEKYEKPVASENLKADKQVQSDHKEIVALAKDITKNSKTELDKLKAIHSWITNHIRYDYDSFNGRKATPPQDAISVLHSRYAICDGYSKLTAALGRASGIPTQIVLGYAATRTWEDTLNYMSSDPHPDYHAWNQAYVDGRWIVLDTTWDSAGYMGEKRISEPTTSYFDPDPVVFASSHTFYAPNPKPDGLKEFYFQLNESDKKIVNNLAFTDLWQSEDNLTSISSYTAVGHMLNGKASAIQAYRVTDGTYRVYTLDRNEAGEWVIEKKESKADYLTAHSAFKLNSY